MKKMYQMPEAVICVLSNEDVIATSVLSEMNTGYFDGKDSDRKSWGDMFK